MNSLNDYFKTARVSELFLIIIIFYGLVIFLTEFLILDWDYYYDHFIFRLDNEEEAEKIATKTKNFAPIKGAWLVVSPILYLLFTTFCLHTGLETTKVRLSFLQVLRVVLIASLVFIIPLLVKFFYFLYLTDFQLSDYNTYSFASLMFLYKNQVNHYALKIILQTFTLFEVLYWLILAQGIKILTKWDYDKSLYMVFISYVIPLLFWLALQIYFVMVMF